MQNEFSGVVAGVGSIPFLKRRKQKAANALQRVMAVQEEGFRVWLKARYGILVSEDTLAGVMPAMSSGNAGEVPFSAVDGQAWVVQQADDKSGSWLVKQQPKKNLVPEADTVAVQEVQHEQLPGEAGAIFAGLHTKLGILKNHDLVAEEFYNLSRIVQEARQAVTTYRKWEALGGDETTGMQKLIFVLTALNDELSGIVRRELAVVGNDLMVQGNYLRSRQLDSGTVTGLSLIEAVDVNRQEPGKGELMKLSKQPDNILERSDKNG